jgi:hypothetical protein
MATFVTTSAALAAGTAGAAPTAFVLQVDKGRNLAIGILQHGEIVIL